MKNLLNFMVALRRLPPLSELTGDEERMLFELRKMFDDKGQLSVSDAYGLSQGKSATTGYRQLLSLRDKGLVIFAVPDSDRRQRTLHFTDKAQQLFNALV